jgi:hypothetical protein
VYKATRKVSEAMEKSEEKEQVMAQMLQSGDVLPAVVEALWSATLIDIDSTLSNVCVNLTQACVNLTQACVTLLRRVSTFLRCAAACCTTARWAARSCPSSAPRG